MSGLPTPSEMLDLTGKVVIVTGATGVIGTGIVRRFVGAGASVLAHTKSGDIAGALTEFGDTVAAFQADLTDADGPGATIAAAVTAFGRVDRLVNNAGIQTLAPFEDLSDEDWSEMIDTNLTAVHRITQAAAGRMRDQGDGGAIVHIASIEGSQPAPLHGHYATAKAGVIMHARAAALSYGSDDIRVNTVSPGLIDQPGLDEAWPEGIARWQHAAPLRRLGKPEDVGDACLFLCSDLARWITGTNLIVDGGVLTHPTW